MKRYAAITFMALSLFIIMHGFSPEKKNVISKTQHVKTVVPSPCHLMLFYPGVLQPVKVATVVSPVEGIIQEMSLHYGNMARKSDTLFYIDSEKFRNDYKSELLQFIKSRSEWVGKENQRKESMFLHDNQLISDDEYSSKETEFYNAQLEMLKSRMSFASLLKQLDLPENSFYQLQIEDIDKISHILQSDKTPARLKITSPVAGVILQPVKGDGGVGELKSFLPGDPVKVGDVLAIIADPDRFMIHLNVSEFNINQMQLGQSVEISGPAFPDFVLTGKIIKLNRQGESKQNGIQSFPVDVMISDLTPEQKLVIRSGMSVKVAVSISEKDKFLVPINAIIKEQDAFYVRILNTLTGKIAKVAVVPGDTVMDSVIIGSSITREDKIVLPD